MYLKFEKRNLYLKEETNSNTIEITIDPADNEKISNKPESEIIITSQR